jgi:hypothetical protein
VVAPLELEHAVAVCKGTRQPHGAHRRLRPGRDESHLLDRRHRVDDLGGQLDLRLGGRTEGGPLSGGTRKRVNRLGIGMPEDQRPPRHDPVDVAVAVDVLDVRTLPAAHEHGFFQADRTHRPDGRVDAPGDDRGRTAPELRSRLHSHAATSLAQ